MSEYAALGSTLAALMTIIMAYGLINKFKKEIQKDVEEKFKSEFKSMREKIDVVKQSADKDLEASKALFDSETDHLSEKIESLREEIKVQHRQTMEQQAQLIEFIRQIIKE